MGSEIAVEAQGESALTDIKSVLSALEVEQRSPTEVEVRLQFPETASSTTDTLSETESDSARSMSGESAAPSEVTPDTNMHKALSLVAHYLERTGTEDVTTNEIVEWYDEANLSATKEQIVSACSSLHLRKGLLEGEQTGDPPASPKRYSMTDAGWSALDRVGGHKIAEEAAPE